MRILKLILISFLVFSLTKCTKPLRLYTFVEEVHVKDCIVTMLSYDNYTLTFKFVSKDSTKELDIMENLSLRISGGYNIPILTEIILVEKTNDTYMYNFVLDSEAIKSFAKEYFHANLSLDVKGRFFIVFDALAFPQPSP